MLSTISQPLSKILFFPAIEYKDLTGDRNIIKSEVLSNMCEGVSRVVVCISFQEFTWSYLRYFFVIRDIESHNL